MVHLFIQVQSAFSTTKTNRKLYCRFLLLDFSHTSDGLPLTFCLSILCYNKKKNTLYNVTLENFSKIKAQFIILYLYFWVKWYHIVSWLVNWCKWTSKNLQINYKDKRQLFNMVKKVVFETVTSLHTDTFSYDIYDGLRNYSVIYHHF